MALCNVFGELALEGTQEEIRDILMEQQYVLLGEILKELRIMNIHLAHLSDQKVSEEDLYVD